jgi:hypothetical protein
MMGVSGGGVSQEMTREQAANLIFNFFDTDGSNVIDQQVRVSSDSSHVTCIYLVIDKHHQAASLPRRVQSRVRNVKVKHDGTRASDGFEHLPVSL